MNQSLTAGKNSVHKKTVVLLLALAALFVSITMAQDFMEASFRNTQFYFSESFMFSSFWWLFVPFIYVQLFFTRHQKANSLFLKLSVMTVPAVLHLFAYPALVWLISKIFYYHTFRFQQTLQYSLSEHLYTLLFFYTVPCMLYLHFTSRKKQAQAAHTAPALPEAAAFEGTIFVQEGTKRISIAVTNILYFTACPPYITVHLSQRKYLHNETLKSVSEKLDQRDFIRIHKSTIVNIRQVASYSSRQNGDYDVTLQGGACMRVSRNYAAAFKAALRNHQVTAK